MAFAKENMAVKAVDDLVVVARITAAHGIKGQVKVQSFTSIPEDFAACGPLVVADGTPIEIRITGEAKERFLAEIKGVVTRDEAEAYKGVAIYANRASLGDLDDGEVFLNDLAGLDVADAAGRVYGAVTKVVNYGSCDLLEVRTPENKTFLVPLTEDRVEMVDFDSGRITVVDVVELMELGGIRNAG